MGTEKPMENTINPPSARDRKARLLARFVNVHLIDDGNRYVVGPGDKREGLRGRHIATIGLRHDSGYEIVLQLDNGKLDSFVPGHLHLEQFYARGSGSRHAPPSDP